MKNYKNQYGTIYAVMLDKHNHPAIMASDPSDGWVVSGTLAPAVSAAEAKTHEELQTVLDTEAEERGWVSCNLPGACDNTIAKPTDATNTMAEPAAPLSEQTDDADGSALAASTGSAMETFDFTALGDDAAEAADDDAQFTAHIGRSREEYAIACVYLAHIHDLTARAGKYGGGTWTAWCSAKELSVGATERMLKIGASFKSTNLVELKNLEQFGKTELLAIAKSGSEEVKAAALDGDSTRVKELLDQLARKDEAIKAAQEANEKNRVRANNAEDDYDAVVQRAEIAERRAREAEAQRKNLQEAEAAHAAKIRELESRPVDVAVRKPTDAEIERYRQEGYVKAQKEFAARRDDESDFCETIADHAEAVADSCAEALAGWFRLAADIDDAAYAAGAEHIKALWLALREALQSGAWPTDDLDDDDDEEYDPDDDDEENSDE